MEGALLHRISILELFFVLNRVRVSDPQWHPYTQTWIRCLPPPGALQVSTQPLSTFLWLINFERGTQTLVSLVHLSFISPPFKAAKGVENHSISKM